MLKCVGRRTPLIEQKTPAYNQDRPLESKP
jgi:hypothetical protein